MHIRCVPGRHQVPPEVDVTSKKVVENVVNNPYPEGTTGIEGGYSLRLLNYFLLDRRVPLYDKAKKRSKNVAKIC